MKIARLLPCTAERINARKKVVCVTYDIIAARKSVASKTTYLRALIHSGVPQTPQC